MLIRLITVLLALVLSGCVLTQNTKEVGLQLPSLQLKGSSSEPIAVAILDARETVVSGAKPDTYIGQYQLAMGDPYDAFTNSKSPMAKEFSDRLPQMLGERFSQLQVVHLTAGTEKTSAIDALLETGAKKVVLITLKEWKTLTHIDTSLWFDMQLESFNTEKQLLSFKRTQGHDTFGGASIAGPITNARRTIPHAFRQKMQALFGDRSVMTSLTTEKAVPIATQIVDAEANLASDAPIKPQACTVELILYWKNAGMADQEILARCNAVKQ